MRRSSRTRAPARVLTGATCRHRDQTLPASPIEGDGALPADTDLCEAVGSLASIRR